MQSFGIKKNPRVNKPLNINLNLPRHLQSCQQDKCRKFHNSNFQLISLKVQSIKSYERELCKDK